MHNPYRLIPLVVSSVIVLALFGVVCWLAVTGNHDMQVAVISYVTGGFTGVAALGTVTTLGGGNRPAEPTNPPTTSP